MSATPSATPPRNTPPTVAPQNPPHLLAATLLRNTCNTHRNTGVFYNTGLLRRCVTASTDTEYEELPDPWQ